MPPLLEPLEGPRPQVATASNLNAGVGATCSFVPEAAAGNAIPTASSKAGASGAASVAAAPAAAAAAAAGAAAAVATAAPAVLAAGVNGNCVITKANGGTAAAAAAVTSIRTLHVAFVGPELQDIIVEESDGRALPQGTSLSVPPPPPGRELLYSYHLCTYQEFAAGRRRHR
ncbi:hypothetical protein Vretifemale_796, partial [Volvox reticuliferus]